MRRWFNVCNVLFLQQGCRRRYGDHRTTCLWSTTLDYFSRFNSCAISNVQCISPAIEFMSVSSYGPHCNYYSLFYKIGTIISRFYPQSLFTYNPMTYVLGSLFLSAFSVPFFFLSVGDLFFSKSFFFRTKYFRNSTRA